ncbi:helix-turn-helix transcriptional regulator [Burkholderia vietnamiensis]|uniref:helix-turn-helix domain-containing protein n=1 Tax=Burkholderia vietnamiensis TaxID=60552 RepID=UPI0031FCD589
MTDFGKFVRARRKMLKLTQTELARRLGVDDAYISAIVDFHRILTHRGCGYFLGLIYVANPRLSRYSMGLR